MIAAPAARRSFGGAAIPTALSDLHQSMGGKMVPFAGYSLPVLYESDTGGVMKEHLHTRSPGCASLFDVSHMGQIRWHGADRVKFMEKLVVGDIAALNEGEARLSLVTNHEGNILDDTVITNAGDHVYMVVNGACKHSDMAHFEKELAAFGGDVQMEYLGDDVQLLALQGHEAAATLGALAPSLDLAKMPFMFGKPGVDVGGIECRVTRCGYTGEDGFEIACATKDAVALAEKLLASPAVNPAGLGARDSLRLEAGLCLYGNDLDDTTNPIEGVLGWTIGPPNSRRRTEKGFNGADNVITADGKFVKVSRKRIGLAGMKAPAREGTEIFDAAGEKKIGVVTSGTMSPTLKKPIAMGYVETAMAKAGTEITVDVRGKKQPAVVTRMPFVEPNYFRVDG